MNANLWTQLLIAIVPALITGSRLYTSDAADE